MAINPERLERYREFTVRHSDENGVYDPEKGLNGLLSILTPDPKLVVLAAMDQGKAIFTSRQLYKDILVWLKNLGISTEVFPVKQNTPWSYCSYEKNGEIRDGSLVEIGAVVKQVHFETLWGGERIGYIKSLAGSELAVPLLPYVCEFVFHAGDSNIPHRFDSMVRLLGPVNSPNTQRKPMSVFKVVDFLLKNPGSHRCIDIQEGLKDQIHPAVIRNILDDLGDEEKNNNGAGIIHYESPYREQEGKKVRGLSRYKLKDEQKLQDIDTLYAEIEKIRGFVSPKDQLASIVQYILKNPQDDYEFNNISEKVAIRRTHVSTVLSSLNDVGVLIRQSAFTGSDTHTQASATYLTTMFYEEVLLPIRELADTLALPHKPLKSTKLAYFLQNYSQERSRVGPGAGKEIRKELMNIMFRLGQPAKANHLADAYNGDAERKLHLSTVRKHLNILTQQGLARKTRRSYYELIAV